MATLKGGSNMTKGIFAAETLKTHSYKSVLRSFRIRSISHLSQALWFYGCNLQYETINETIITCENDELPEMFYFEQDNYRKLIDISWSGCYNTKFGPLNLWLQKKTEKPNILEGRQLRS